MCRKKDVYFPRKAPKRCIDPIMQYCQGCKYGITIYPEGTTREDVQEGCCFDTICMYDLENTIPTKREKRKFEKECKKHDKLLRKQGLRGTNKRKL